MSPVVEVDRPLTWRQVGAIGEEGAALRLAPAALERIEAARGLVRALIERNVRAYGVNTGVGALCEVVVSPAKQRELSRNIIMSHAVGVGPPLEAAAVRAIIAAAINQFAHGYSGVRPVVVERLCRFLALGIAAAAQAYDLGPDEFHKAAATDAAYRRVRRVVGTYRDDHPLAGDVALIRAMLRAQAVQAPD